MRGVPHRPASARRRGRDRRAASDPRTPDRRHGRVHRGRRLPAPTSSGAAGGRGRVGVPWLGWTCGECAYCRSGRENLCDRAPASPDTTSTAAWPSTPSPTRASAFRSPPATPTLQAAPLLCAGLIGYRALRMAGERSASACTGSAPRAHPRAGRRCQGRRGVRVHPARRRGRRRHSRASSARPGPAARRSPRPSRCDAAMIFAPVGALVPRRCARLAPGGTVVCAGIHMSDIPSFPYSILWGERAVRSVANLTRRDGEEFLALAPPCRSRPHVTAYRAASDASGARGPARRTVHGRRGDRALTRTRGERRFPKWRISPHAARSARSHATLPGATHVWLRR